MYIAKGMYQTTGPETTKFEALVTLLVKSTTPVVKKDDSWEVTLKADGYDPSIYLYSTEFTAQEALADAVLCHYPKFGIKLFKEI